MFCSRHGCGARLDELEEEEDAIALECPACGAALAYCSLACHVRLARGRGDPRLRSPPAERRSTPPAADRHPPAPTLAQATCGSHAACCLEALAKLRPSRPADRAQGHRLLVALLGSPKHELMGKSIKQLKKWTTASLPQGEDEAEYMRSLAAAGLPEALATLVGELQAHLAPGHGWPAGGPACCRPACIPAAGAACWTSHTSDNRRPRPLLACSAAEQMLAQMTRDGSSSQLCALVGGGVQLDWPAHVLCGLLATSEPVGGRCAGTAGNSPAASWGAACAAAGRPLARHRCIALLTTEPPGRPAAGCGGAAS
jgi:hypothetical protein